MPRARDEPKTCDLGKPVQSSGNQQLNLKALLVVCLLTNATHSVLIPKNIPKLIYPERSSRRNHLLWNGLRGHSTPTSHLGDSTETSPVIATSVSSNQRQHGTFRYLSVAEESRREYFYPEIYPETWPDNPRSSHGSGHCKPQRIGVAGACLTTTGRCG
jgi:hypothetical protein